MRALAIAVSMLSLVSTAAAQEADVQAVHDLSTCIAQHQTALTRIVRLLDEARERQSSSDEAVRRDAGLSIETLLQRAVEARDHLRICVEHARFEAPSGETVEHTTTPDATADRVATSGGSIHEVEADAAVSEHVRVVRGERVDGSGSAPDASVRSAVHALGSALSLCYDDYLDRSSSRQGSVHVSFTVLEGGRVSAAAVERAGFDAPLRQCVQRAFTGLHVEGAHGRSVYAYELSLGE